MTLDTLQKTLYDYLCENKLFSKLIPFSGIATIIYGVYFVLNYVPFLSSIIGVFQYIAGILYFLSILGLIISFAKNNMMPIVVLFALMGIGRIIDVIMLLGNGYIRASFIVSPIVYAIIYLFIAYKAMVRYNKS